jgi:hypothetical protein
MDLFLTFNVVSDPMTVFCIVSYLLGTVFEISRKDGFRVSWITCTGAMNRMKQEAATMATRLSPCRFQRRSLFGNAIFLGFANDTYVSPSLHEMSTQMRAVACSSLEMGLQIITDLSQ